MPTPEKSPEQSVWKPALTETETRAVQNELEFIRMDSDPSDQVSRLDQAFIATSAHIVNNLPEHLDPGLEQMTIDILHTLSVLLTGQIPSVGIDPANRQHQAMDRMGPIPHVGSKPVGLVLSTLNFAVGKSNNKK